MKKKLRFIVPHSLFSEGLINILSATGRYEISEQADILLIDTSMVRKEIVDVAFVDNPGAKLIVIGREAVPTMAEMVEMIELGCCAYVRGNLGSGDLVGVIELVHQGNCVWPAEVLEGLRLSPFQSQATMTLPIELPADRPGPRLSPREEVILRGLMDGLANKVIARQTNIAEATVKVHVKALLRKLRVANRTQAAMWAHSHGYNGVKHESQRPDCDASRRYDESAPEPGQFPPLLAVQSAGGHLPERAASAAP